MSLLPTSASLAFRRIVTPLCTVGFLLSSVGTADAYDTLSVDITGPFAEPLTPILQNALLLNDLDEEARADGAQVLATARADYARAVEVMFAAGFYGATVSITLDGAEAARIAPLSAPRSVETVTVTVDLGRRFRMGQVSIAPLAPGDSLPETLDRGEPAQADLVRDAILGRITAWREASHAKARIADQRITARHGGDRLDVAVRIDPGPALRFGSVPVQSESAVRAPRIRQIAGIPQGAPYHPDDVEKAAARLRSAGAFRSVTLTEAETPNPDGTLDVAIEVVDRAPRRIGAGAEVSTQEAVALSGFWLHRNILGGGERLRAEASAAQLGGTTVAADYALSLRFEKPAVYGPDTAFFAEASVNYEDEEDFLDQNVELSFGASRTFSDTLNGSLGVAIRRADIVERFRGRDANGNFPSRQFTLIGLPTTLTWDLRDDAQNATGGTPASWAMPNTTSDGVTTGSVVSLGLSSAAAFV